MAKYIRIRGIKYIRIPKTLIEAIIENPERFLDDLDTDKIKKSINPYLEFIRQFQKKFDGKKQGLELWKYVEGRYKILNLFFKSKIIQNKLKKQFKGSLNREITKKFMQRHIKQKEEKQRRLFEIKIEKPLRYKEYTRKNVKVRGYRRSKPHTYDDKHIKFIKSRLFIINNKTLAYDFNSFFKTFLSTDAIKSKKLRLRKEYKK